ncbi:hypothetical protein GOARA_019_00010, partial [Gordonia araii NBRC 100433]
MMPPPGPGWYGPPPPPRSRKGLWAGLAGVLVVLIVAVCATLYFVFGFGMSDSDKISKTINGFAEAVDTMNTPKTLSLLCESEARQIREHEDYDPNDDSTIDPLERRPVNISNLRINGDVAHVTVTRPPGRPHE